MEMRSRARGAARKVEPETCRESRSRKLDFRKARSLFPPVPLAFPLFRRTDVRMQQPGRRPAIFRTGASRRTFLDYKSRLYRRMCAYPFCMRRCTGEVVYRSRSLS